MRPQNLPEFLIWSYLLGNLILYFLGAQSVTAPLLAFFLVLYGLKQWWEKNLNSLNLPKITIAPTIWIWVIAMLTIELTWIVSWFLNSEWNLKLLVRSTVQDWLRNWGLFALFPLAGHLQIRPQLICRATCILCLQVLILIPILYLAYRFLSLPYPLYISPLQVIFKGYPTAYAVSPLYREDYRLALFAPWPAPFGLLACTLGAIAGYEQNKFWKTIGLTSCGLMIILSGSRLALLTMIATSLLVFCLSRLAQPWLQFTASFVSLGIGFLLFPLLNLLEGGLEAFHKARPGSSNERLAIMRIGIRRWWSEAPIWGHGPPTMDRFPRPIARIGIGSHDTWVSLLFDHGLVGCLALAIAFLWSLIHLTLQAQRSSLARLGLHLLLILLCFTVGEPIYNYAYLFWPSLILLGIAFKEKLNLGYAINSSA